MHWVADIIAALPILRLEACGSPRLECNGIGIGASASTGRDIGSRPPSYFAVPLAGCLVIALGTDALLNATSVQTLADAASLKLLIGMSYTATVTAVNSVTPTIPAPVIMASIVGFYHVVGITIVPIIVIISI